MEDPRFCVPALAFLTTAVVFCPAVHGGTVILDGLDLPSFWGLAPSSYRLVHVCLHAFNAALFSAVAAWLLRAAWAAGPEDAFPWWWGGLAGLLFAAHPLRVESAAWATERGGVLCGTFYLLSAFLYLAAAAAESEGPAGGRRRALLRAGSWTACAGASLYGSIAATLPLLLLLFDIYPLRRLRADPRRWGAPQARRVIIEKAPYVLCSLLIVFAGFYGRGHEGPYDFGSLREAALSPCRFLLCLGKTLWPIGLAPVYETAFQRATADRHSYLPCLPWALLAAAGFGAWAGRGKSPLRLGTALGAAAAIVGTLFVLTRLQIGYWHDPETLWARAATVRPHSAMARAGLGDVLAAKGDLKGAFAQYQRSLEQKPDFAAAHYGLGKVYSASGQRGLAVRFYQNAISLDPRRLDAFNDLGVALFSEGLRREAIAVFRRALAQGGDETRADIRFRRADLMNNLGNALLESSAPKEALKYYSEAVRRTPADPKGHHNSGVAWLRLGR
ncbi:MAG: tetratricopeptide repeat protein, partial [candidate division NC10 bacterium]